MKVRINTQVLFTALFIVSSVIIVSLLCDLLYIAIGNTTLPLLTIEDTPTYTPYNAPGEILTDEFAVSVGNAEEAVKLAEELNLNFRGPIGTLENYYLFQSRGLSPTQAQETIGSALGAHPSVRWFEQQTLRWRYPRTATRTNNTNAKDDGGSLLPKDPLFPEQWHLHNVGQHGGTKGEDMRVLGAWNITRGAGVCVAIVDDGLAYNHPDLKKRYSAANSHNFNADGAPTDPTPIPGDSHGTMCAGATAASTNEFCGVGVAFEASVSGLRILGGPSSDAMEAQALTYMYHGNHIYSSSWGPTDNGLTLEGPGPLTKAALADGITRGRGGKGSVYIWAAGNGARFGDNCNYDGYASSRYVLTVGAVNHFGKHAYYSEPCAAIIVSAPSSGKDLVGITTTDMNNDCTNDFTGTSASAPLVAGVAALMLAANGNLTWRDVHHIMAQTARINDPYDSDWSRNGGGLLVNHKYGFGVVDAHSAVVLAKSWQPVGKELSFASPVIEVHAPIPDNSHQPVVSVYHVDEDIILEHVEIVFTASHPYRSDLRVVLTSPKNTKSVLSTLHGTSSGYDFQVVSPANLTKSHWQIVRASFGPSPADWMQQNATTRIVLANPIDGCELSDTTDLSGSLVLVQRGKCDFCTKVKNAQNRGAAGVLVIPENEGDSPAEMDGMDSSIVIPAVMLSGKDGFLIKSHLSSSVPVVGMLVSRVHKQAGLLPFNDWSFSTVRNWNESSVGDWTLSVSDWSSGGVGTFERWQLKLYGTQGGYTATPKPHKHQEPKVNTTKIALFTVVVVSIAVLGVVLGWLLLSNRPTNYLPVAIPMQTKQPVIDT